MSQNPLVKKLRIVEGSRVLVLNAPEGYLESLGELPAGASVAQSGNREFDVVQAFFTAQSDLDAALGRLKSGMGTDGILWVSYPKGTSKEATDLNRDTLRECLAADGLTAVAQVAVDDTWSALRFKIS